MFEKYRSRMDFRGGKNVSSILRKQSELVIEKTWDRDPHYRQVYVCKVKTGLPHVKPTSEPIDAKFNIHTYQSITSDEVAYLLQFRKGAEKFHKEIDVGSYVYMEDEDGNWKWWLLVHLDERPEFRQWQILECNYTFKWVYEGNVYQCLGVHRVQQSYNSGSWDGDRFTFVDDITAAWLPSNQDTYTIGYNQRFIIADLNHFPPLTWTVSKLENAQPIGLTKLKFTQETFDPAHDNAELGLANYYDFEILPTPIEDKDDDILPLHITFNGTSANIKVGGSTKIFTADPLVTNGIFRWAVDDGATQYGVDTFNDYEPTVFGDYTLSVEDGRLHVTVAKKFALIGTVLKISARTVDGRLGLLECEVIG